MASNLFMQFTDAVPLQFSKLLVTSESLYRMNEILESYTRQVSALDDILESGPADVYEDWTYAKESDMRLVGAVQASISVFVPDVNRICRSFGSDIYAHLAWGKIEDIDLDQFRSLVNGTNDFITELNNLQLETITRELGNSICGLDLERVMPANFKENYGREITNLLEMFKENIRDFDDYFVRLNDFILPDIMENNRTFEQVLDTLQ